MPTLVISLVPVIATQTTVLTIVVEFLSTLINHTAKSHISTASKLQVCNAQTLDNSESNPLVPWHLIVKRRAVARDH